MYVNTNLFQQSRQSSAWPPPQPREATEPAAMVPPMRHDLTLLCQRHFAREKGRVVFFSPARTVSRAIRYYRQEEGSKGPRFVVLTKLSHSKRLPSSSLTAALVVLEKKTIMIKLVDIGGNKKIASASRMKDRSFAPFQRWHIPDNLN